MTKEEFIIRLKELAISLGSPRLRRKDLADAHLINPLYKYFDNLDTALKAANLQSTPLAQRMVTTDKQRLQYIYTLGERLGHRPRVKDIRQDGKYTEKIFKRFGNVRKAYELALNQFGPKSSAAETKQASSTLEGKSKIKKSESPDFPYKPLFWGRAGETYVVAELMYHGFNASLLPVDLGIDVQAVKDNRTFYFQVKNVDFSRASTRSVPITYSSFDRNRMGNMFYVFVLVNESNRDALVIPYQTIYSLIRRNIIQPNNETKDFTITLTWKENIVVVHSADKQNKTEDLSNYINDWNAVV